MRRLRDVEDGRKREGRERNKLRHRIVRQGWEGID